MVQRIQVCEDRVEDTLMLVSAEAFLMSSSSSSDNNGLVWKKIWKIQTPNMIRHFIWRAAKDSLPTK